VDSPRRRNRPRHHRAAAGSAPEALVPWFLPAVIALIVYGSLYPWHFDFVSRHPNPLLVLFHSWKPQWDRFMLADAAVNLALYFPLGLTAVPAFRRRWPGAAAAAMALLLGLALSASMEILQVYVPGRDCSLLDVAYNVSGTLAGAAAALVFRSRIENLAGRRHGRWGLAAWVLIACWAGYQLYPLIPHLSRTRLREGLLVLVRPGTVSPVEVWSAAAEWLAVALLLSALGRALRPGWLAVAMLSLPLRLLIVDRHTGLEEILGAAAALLIWSGIGPLSPGACAWVLGSAIAARGLAPFRFSAAPRHFSWIPFGASMEDASVFAVVVLFRKAFDYGAEVWLLAEAGVPYVWGGAGVACALAAFEWAQRWLPGRSAEITDPLLALGMALLLRRVSRKRT
jgi:VanZ family protein